ncbi:MBL fold metallo-hydrolase [Acetivibrio clariflavus]|uniref:Metal-dependent hydrolase, beta-lactamase superfamily III n=1 Tax=Acetivibrio clariflavus (strain DSM 19732 / NBRC 101661 / EBR45) TaxID=720554 RepID=G8LSS5_ACECE|nr:MBL fold metallo-hydrolase [Acetivibrio clariflavus]AEV69427.1 metal-dependent hydrolase, beta-lactamase superfamily III [Acetivibrio clariflavus DSM 19732]
MKITILGNNGPFPSAGGACSGYLVREGDKNILIDCGNGVLSNLQKFIPIEKIDAIILSHLHSDHMSDLMILRYAVQIKMNRGSEIKPIDVYAPPQPQNEYSQIDIPGVFNLKPITADLVLNFGDMRMEFKEMVHPVMSFAVSIVSQGKKFVFSGDTSWNEGIIEFAKDADLLMLDAGLLSKDKKSDNVPHLTAKECGVVAQKANVKRLLLTHFWPEDNVSDHIAEARENFSNVEIAGLLNTYDV